MKVVLIILVILQSISVWSWAEITHKNSMEDSIIYMETAGTVQQRWASDYLKAKMGGRNTGSCENIFYPEIVYDNSENDPDDEQQCGAIGSLVVGSIQPDYLIDTFWTNKFGNLAWSADFGESSNLNYDWLSYINYTSFSHHINMNTEYYEDHNGFKPHTRIYNDFDGYSYQADYAYKLSWGYANDSRIGLQDGRMVIDLQKCTHGDCYARKSRYANFNIAIDYKQNGSKTPVDLEDTYRKDKGEYDERRLDWGSKSNYNCYSDYGTIGNCPDLAYRDISEEFYKPNRAKHLDCGKWTWGDECNRGYDDWVIFEPTDNAGTFYYNELFLEGRAFKSTKYRNMTLQKYRIVDRYYNISAGDFVFLGMMSHFLQDTTEYHHNAATLDFEHKSFEHFIDDEYYGLRVVGENDDSSKNMENYYTVQRLMTLRQYRFRNSPGHIDKTFMEAAFVTHTARYRDGYNVFKEKGYSGNERAAKLAINNAITGIVLALEKSVIDLRKCRNSDSCDNM